MWTRATIARGVVEVDGVPFRWAVTEGVKQWLTVQHATRGMQIQPLCGSPDSQTRVVARAMLARRHASDAAPTEKFLHVRKPLFRR